MGPANVDCPGCLVKPAMARFAKYAWTVTALAVAVLFIVFALGARGQAAWLTAGGGLFLILLLACPLMMGGMMWMMMRGGHHH